jgi:hypothetical protein
MIERALLATRVLRRSIGLTRHKKNGELFRVLRVIRDAAYSAGRRSLTYRRPLGAQRGSRSEQQIQRAVFQHLAIRAAPGTFAFHPANGGWRSRVEGAIFKGLGVRAGIPDIVAIKDGKCFFLELKAPDGRLTLVQRDAHAALAAAGATVAVAYGLDEALARLEAWGLVRGSCQGRLHHRGLE